MAQLSLGEVRWRMLRLALKHKRFRFEDCRLYRRKDRVEFDWLVAGGFFVAAGDDQYEVTAKGEAAADLGYYDWEPPRQGPDRTTPINLPKGRKR